MGDLWDKARAAIEQDEAITRSLRNPSVRLRAAAEVIYAAGIEHGWSGFTKTYEQLERTDQLGFGEFNAIVDEALAAADAKK